MELEDLFRLDRLVVLPYEEFDNVWVSVTVEMDLNLSTYERTVYNILDLLADVGGLLGILIAFCAFIVAVENSNHFDTSLTAKLFKIKKSEMADVEEIAVSPCLPSWVE